MNFDIYKNISLSQAGANGSGGGGGGGTTSFQTDNGIATPAAGVITFNAISQAGASVSFSGSGSTVRLNISDGVGNIFMGLNSGNGTVSGNDNCFVGTQAGQSLTSGGTNVGFGINALNAATSANTNLAFGTNAYRFLVTGARNMGYGDNVGSNYTTTESDNITIGYHLPGTALENNVLRIGNGTGTGNGQLAKAFIAGINGAPVTNALMVIINSSTDQLGAQAIPQGANAWTVVTAATQVMAINNGYIANRASNIAFSLPATASVGDILRLTGINTALGWTITQAANQQIFFGTSSTTLGVTGTLSSSAIRDSVELVCVVAGASTVWNVLSSIGNITIV